MDKSDELLKRCFKCKSYQEDDCGIYFMMALWQKECIFFKIMTEKYKEYLTAIEIISEEDFNEVIESLPEVKINFSEVYFSDYIQSKDSLACDLINYILDGAYLNECNFKDKIISIENVDTTEDLEKIKNLFSNWTISNYEELLKDLKESENDGYESDLRNMIDSKLCYINDVCKLKDVLGYVNNIIRQ